MGENAEKKSYNVSLMLSIAAVSFFTLAGICLFIYYKDMPIVRNSLIYARITYNLFDLGEAFQAGRDGYNKPLGFAYLTLPFFEQFGANIGLKIVSLISTVAWGVSCFFIYCRFSGYWLLSSKQRPVFLLLLFLNPLIFYQFISGYPDMLYGLAFLWSMFFLDRVLSDDVNWVDPFLLTFSLLFSIWIKHNGLIIFPVIIVFLICRRKTVLSGFTSARCNKLLLALVCIVFAVGLLVYENTAQSNIFNFVHNKSNFLKGGSRLLITITNTKFMLLYLLVTFNCFIFLNRIKNLKARPEWFISIMICMLSLLYFDGTRYNLRYYFPLAPFFTFFVLSGWNSIKPGTKYGVLILFLIINIPLTIVYNSITVHAYASQFIHIPKFDNLRLVNEQLKARTDIDLINQLFRKGPRKKYLVYLSDYYGDASHNVWTREEFVSSDINVIYRRSWDYNLHNWALKNGSFLLYASNGSYPIPGTILAVLDFKKVSNQLYIVKRKH